MTTNSWEELATNPETGKHIPMRKLLTLIFCLLALTDASSQKATSPKKHFIGEHFEGGIVFYTCKNGRHGLISSTEDQGTSLPWYIGEFGSTGADEDGIRAGAKNTKLIVAAQAHDSISGNFAAQICADYFVTVDGRVFDDWYLPSACELNLLYKQRNVVGIIMDVHLSDSFWSSTETDANNATSQGFYFGNVMVMAGKGNINRVRAIRHF